MYTKIISFTYLPLFYQMAIYVYISTRECISVIFSSSVTSRYNMCLVISVRVLYPSTLYILLVVIELAEDFLSNYSHVTIGSADLVANHDITQIIEVCPHVDKPAM